MAFVQNKIGSSPCMGLVCLIGVELRIIKCNEKHSLHVTETFKRPVGGNMSMFTMKLILKLIKFWGKIIMQVEKYGDMDIWEWKENGNNIKFEHNLGFFPDFCWGYYIRLVSLDDRKYVWVNCHLEYLSCMTNFIHNFVLTGVFRDALRRNCFFMKIKNKKRFLPKYFTTKQRKCTFKTISYLTHISFINLLERYERLWTALLKSG